MRGLRKREDSKFEKFFEIVQDAAKRKGCVFFLDCGEGRDLETEDLSGEDLSGWLIPEGKAGQFEKEFLGGNIREAWNEFIAFATWHSGPNSINISFQQF